MEVPNVSPRTPYTRAEKAKLKVTKDTQPSLPPKASFNPQPSQKPLPPLQAAQQLHSSLTPFHLPQMCSQLSSLLLSIAQLSALRPTELLTPTLWSDPTLGQAISAPLAGFTLCSTQSCCTNGSQWLWMSQGDRSRAGNRWDDLEPNGTWGATDRAWTLGCLGAPTHSPLL